MPSEYKTKNLNLNQWAGNEYAKRQDFVDDNKKIDDAIGELKNSIGNVKVPVTSVNNKDGDVVLKAKDITTEDDKTIEQNIKEVKSHLEEIAIYNANCNYENEYKIILINTRVILPNYFTIRFKAPNNYVNNANFNINGVIYTSKNASFEANDIVSVEFDKVNKKCFFKVGGINETLPPQIENFNVISGNAKLDLTWAISDTTYLSGYVFTIKENSVPKNVNDGTKYYVDKVRTSYTISRLNNNIKYYIRPFPYNNKKQYQSEYIVGSGTPIDSISLTDLPIGSKIKFGKYQVESETPQSIIWKLIDKNHYKDQYNTGIVNHITLLADKILDLRCFDAKEPSSMGDIDKYGYSKYSLSNLRQFLNSDKLDWYTPTHGNDKPPRNEYIRYNAEYETKSGFLNLFTQREIDSIVPTNLRVELDEFIGSHTLETVTDKVFLLSKTEVGLEAYQASDNSSYREGKLFEIFNNSNENRKSLVTKECIDNTKLTYSNLPTISSNWEWWLRSLHPQFTHEVVCVSGLGKRALYGACESMIGLKPALNLDVTKAKLKATPDADGCYVLL